MTEGHTERLEAALAGRYKIERKLGEGGMAAVYLAEDLKHERKVALKILRPELAAVIGAERFLSEIKTTANLQHPHILPLFDSGSADGYLYYVMPYIDGETLREKLDREKQLGVEESVRIARDVADALDYAHRHGVIHRDIKPGNILLHDGRPVVADFGIALAVSAAGGGRMTETGLSLGTPHYMSPEQASADRDLSARSDVYSLGCVLYEMLAGQPPHPGPSAQSILVHILTEDAKPLASLRHTVPPNVAAAVAKSIEKLPADRFETAKAFREAIEDPAFTYVARPRTPGAGIATPALSYAAPPRPWLRDARSVAALAVAAVTTALAAWGWLGGGARAPEATPVRFTFTPGLDATFGHNGGLRDLAISPDGSFVVYNGSNADGTAPRLYVRMLGELEGVALRGADDGMAPVVSPDGAWVAFITRADIDVLQRVSALGGAPVALAQAPGMIMGVSWGRDGDIIFAAGGASGNRALYRVPEAGGEPVALATPEGELESYVWPSLIEGRQAVLFVITNSGPTLNTYDDGELATLDLRSGEITRLDIQGSNPRYLSTGHLLYAVADGSVRAVPFDADALTATGAAVPLIEGIQITDSGSADYDVSDDGRLVYSASSGAGAPAGRSLVWVDRDGREQPIGAEQLSYVYPRLSPDGRRLALDVRTPYSGIRVWDFSGETLTPLTLGEDRFPTWTPDGRRIAYSTGGGVFSMAANNTGTPEPLLEDTLVGDSSSLGIPYFFTSDGDTLVYSVRNPETELDLEMAALAGPEPEVVGQLIQPGSQRNAELSPDGAWMAYESDESGRWEVYVRPFPDVQGDNVQVSNEGGRWPLWSRDGRELFYVEGGGFETKLMAVTIEGRRMGGSFGYTNRRPLMDWPYYNRLAGRSYDVAADGRFVAISGERVTEGQQMTIVTNWFTELRERMGGR